MAARNVEPDTPPKISRLEDIENEKTFILFDPALGSMYVQLDIRDLTSDAISVYLNFPNKKKKEIPLTRDGYILRGGPVLFRDTNQLYIDSSDSHSLILGNTGSMKTLRFVLPLIFTCAKAGESMIVIDPKGELSRKMSPFLSKEGYKNVVLNLRTPQKSPDRWNPLERVEKAYYAANIPLGQCPHLKKMRMINPHELNSFSRPFGYYTI